MIIPAWKAYLRAVKLCLTPFVLVYFVSENPYDESMEIPVIVDKLVK